VPPGPATGPGLDWRATDGHIWNTVSRFWPHPAAAPPALAWHDS